MLAELAIECREVNLQWTYTATTFKKKHKKQRQTNPMISFYFQQQTKSHF